MTDNLTTGQTHRRLSGQTDRRLTGQTDRRLSGQTDRRLTGQTKQIDVDIDSKQTDLTIYEQLLTAKHVQLMRQIQQSTICFTSSDPSIARQTGFAQFINRPQTWINVIDDLTSDNPSSFVSVTAIKADPDYQDFIDNFNKIIALISHQSKGLRE